MTDVVCPEYRSRTVTESVRNLTENSLVLAVKNIDCYDWSNTGNPSQTTGRVLDSGQTARYRLEQSSRSRYDLGVLVGTGSGLRRVGTMSLERFDNGNVFVPFHDPGIVLEPNTGENITEAILCARQLLGKDPARTKSTGSFNPNAMNVTWIYSDGTNLYGVRCAS